MHARRRLLVLGAAALAWPLAAIAQPTRSVLRVGILEDASEDAQRHLWRAFLARLRELGYVEGRNLAVEARYARGATKRLPMLAAELVRLKPDVIVTRGSPASLAAKQATAAVPIVFVGTRDPVSVGLVTSLARPGGNATGLSALQEEVATKWIELLLELAPAAKRVGFLGDTTNKGVRLTFADLQKVAQLRKLAVVMLDARQRQDVDRSFVALATERCDGLIVGSSSINLDHRDQILQFAARQKVPVVYARREYVDAGGLLSYGVDLGVMYLRAAEYVHRIAQGAKPAELPVERVNVVRLVVNMKTARALGINIPQRVLVRADEVIE